MSTPARPFVWTEYDGYCTGTPVLPEARIHVRTDDARGEPGLAHELALELAGTVLVTLWPSIVYLGVMASMGLRIL